MPFAAISIFPPLPLKALAVISLFFIAANVLVLIMILPPFPVPLDVAVIELLFVSCRFCVCNFISPPSPEVVAAEMRPVFSNKILLALITRLPAFPSPSLLTVIKPPSTIFRFSVLIVTLPERPEGFGGSLNIC